MDHVDRASPAPGDRIKLIALSVGQQNIVAGLGHLDRRVVFRPEGRIWEVAEGEIVHATVRRCWTFGRRQYLSGTIDDMVVDVPAWGLPALGLRRTGHWDPRKELLPEWDRGLTATPAGQYLRAIIGMGPRPVFEMAQVLPGADRDGPDSDPILDALDARDCGDWDTAYERLQECLRQDLRCIDAHAHLGHFQFGDGKSERGARAAFKHYSVGVAAGDYALGPDFNGILQWGWVDNRPFLRCLHGLGLAAWRLGDFTAARRVMERLLWLDPADPLDAVTLLESIRAGQPYAAADPVAGH